MTISSSDERFFFLHVPKYLLMDLPFFEKYLLSADIKNEIFKKAVELGYERKNGENIKEQIENILFHPNFPPFEIELIEKNYCLLSLAHLVQERVDNCEILPEQLKILDWFLQRYDPIMPDLYLQSKSDDVVIPEYKHDSWISSLDLDIEHELCPSADWITLYSHTEFNFRDVMSPYGHEFSNLVTAFCNKDNKIDEINFTELIDIPLCGNIAELKTLKLYSKEKYPLKPFLFVRRNNYDLHFSNTVVRVDTNFIASAKLSWINNTTLDMQNNDSLVLRYQSWCGPYIGESHSRYRTAQGVRLQIKKQFLLDYLNSNGLSLFVIGNKKRTLANETICDYDEKDSKTLNEQKIFTFTELTNALP